jgi:SAM-dependent methyltransferase
MNTVLEAPESVAPMTRCVRIHRALNITINKLLKQHARKGGTLLDVGCWDGETTLSYARTVQAREIVGIECMKAPAEQARSKGIKVVEANLETEAWGLPEASVDIAVCNQVFEHLKNIFIPFDQIARALKPGGVLLISVPNLASFHNRGMLFLGMQPTCIRVWGPHVRGYTLREFTKFCLTLGLFEIIKIEGVGFYPFIPELGGNLLATLWKDACVTPVWLLRRTGARPRSFQEKYLSAGELTLM